MREQDLRLEMLAETALQYNNKIISEKLRNERLSFPDAVAVLSATPNYDEVLPTALAAYTQNGDFLGRVISGYRELGQRTIVAKELIEILEKDPSQAYDSALGLDDIDVKTQLIETRKLRVKSDNPYRDVDGNNSLLRLVIMNAMYKHKEVTDTLLKESSVSTEMIELLQLAVEKCNPSSYDSIVSDIFKLYSQLSEKRDLEVLKPGVNAGDAELTSDLRSYANRYLETKKEQDRCWTMPKFNQPVNRYQWDGNTFADTVRRITSLFETGKASVVSKVLSRMNGTESRGYRSGNIHEEPRETLESAEKLKSANLPEEVYIAFGTEFENLSITDFVSNILQEPVLSRIKELDKMHHTLGKAAIAYTACHETPEDVAYVAEHIFDVTPLGNARQIYKAVMRGGRNGHGAKRLSAFLPEGIDFLSLTDTAKKIVRRTGFMELKSMPILHEVLSENQDLLNLMIKVPGRSYFNIYSWDAPDEAKDKFEQFLGWKRGL